MKSEASRLIKENGLIVIVRGAAPETLIPLADSLYEGGIRLIELTYDMSGKTSDSVTAEGIKRLNERFGGKMCVGAGTVLSKAQVELTAAAGGRFVLSPDFDPEVVRATLERGLVSIPGAITPTEAAAAYKCGADFVKLFPLNILGCEYLKMLKAPLSAVPFIAVGNVDLQSIHGYFEAGACAVSVGGAVVRRDLIQMGDYSELSRNAALFVKAVRQELDNR